MNSRLLELARIFLTFGLTAFGGPAAHIAMYHDEFVKRRKWLDQQHFMDLLGATHLIPGPNSTEMCIHIGYLRAGWPGLIVAGVSFILPSTLMVIGLAWGYVRYGHLPPAVGMAAGITPVVVAILFQALIGLGRATLTTRPAWVIAAVCVALYLMGVSPLLLLALSGMLMLAMRSLPRLAATLSLALPLAQPPALLATLQAAEPFSLTRLFLAFLKIGAVLYGSGYVLVAFLQADFVDGLGWITQTQLLDAVAIGQITPGPVFTTAAFIGYLLAGVPGALVATLGIFLPSFIFVAISNPLIPRIRRSPAASALLDGVNAASLGLMAGVTVELAYANLLQPVPALIAAAALLALMRFHINTTWLILGGALLGLLVAA